MTLAAWRLVSPKWAASAFDGEGARLAGGRWNSRGTPLVYLSSSLALAALELLVHIDYERALRNHYAIPVAFDEALVRRLETEQLPENWTAVAAIPVTQALGDAWAKSGTSAILAVPSAVVPRELNYLLNPKHPDASRVNIGEPEMFLYAPRVLKERPLSSE